MSVDLKVLDKDFKKEFQDVPKNVINTLYKLFKRRPRFVLFSSLS